MTRARVQLWRVGLAVVIAGGLVLNTAPPALATTRAVTIRDASFKPKNITIEKGTRVKWTNKGDLVHNVTRKNGKWTSGPLSPGETFARTFKVKGTINYLCTIHGFTGKIVVT
jgi:plastocyanin